MRAMYHNAAFQPPAPVFDIREKFGTTDIVIDTAAKGRACQVLATKRWRCCAPMAWWRWSGLPVAVFAIHLQRQRRISAGAGPRRA
jgi:hypothetical protein